MLRRKRLRPPARPLLPVAVSLAGLLASMLVTSCAGPKRSHTPVSSRSGHGVAAAVVDVPIAGHRYRLVVMRMVPVATTAGFAPACVTDHHGRQYGLSWGAIDRASEAPAVPVTITSSDGRPLIVGTSDSACTQLRDFTLEATPARSVSLYNASTARPGSNGLSVTIADIATTLRFRPLCASQAARTPHCVNLARVDHLT